MLVHVVDAATENPVKDYMTVKEVKLCLFLYFCLHSPKQLFEIFASTRLEAFRENNRYLRTQ